jgi:hypothetical protein
MTDIVGSMRRSGKVRRESIVVFPSQFVEAEYETRLACIRCAVWCVVFEVGLCIAVILVWRLWST